MEASRDEDSGYRDQTRSTTTQEESKKRISALSCSASSGKHGIAQLELSPSLVESGGDSNMQTEEQDVCQFDHPSQAQLRQDQLEAVRISGPRPAYCGDRHGGGGARDLMYMTQDSEARDFQTGNQLAVGMHNLDIAEISLAREHQASNEVALRDSSGLLARADFDRLSQVQVPLTSSKFQTIGDDEIQLRQPKLVSDDSIRLQDEGGNLLIESQNLNQQRALNFETARKGDSNNDVRLFESSGQIKLGSQGMQASMPDFDPEDRQYVTKASQVPAKVDFKAPSVDPPATRESFISLFVIFGLNASSFVQNDLEESYEVLGSYPDLESNPKAAAEHKFTQDLRSICFPEVELGAERFHLSKMDPLCRCNFLHFITTSDMGAKKYITSVHFKEILLSEQGAFVVDKAVCVASSLPVFSVQKQLLQQVFQKVVLKNNDVSIKAFKEAQRTYEGFLDEWEQPPPQDFPNFVYKFMMDEIMCADQRKQRDRASPERTPSPPARQQVAKAITPNMLVDFTPVLELYVSVFSHYLYFQPDCERDIHIVKGDIGVVSGYGTNQSIFGGGQAPSEKSSSTVDKGNKNQPLFKFRNLKPFGFQLENFAFELILQKMKPEKLIQLFSAMLLERKVVLIKDEIGEIALLMQALITLLNPFQWYFTVIAYLNRELVDMLDSPFPFLIGVSTRTWEDICSLKDYPEDIYIFDLESQERRYIARYEMPELPRPFGDDLLAGLKDVMEKKDRRLEALRAEIKQSKSHISKRHLDQQFDEQYWADAQLSVKQLFFNFLLHAVNNYMRFYRTPEDGFGSQDQLGNFMPPDDFFDTDGYLKWQEERAAKHGQDNAFMREFVKTQTFHEFIEQNYNGDKEGESTNLFFESCLEILSESSFKRLKQAQQEMIDQAKFNLGTPVKLKFTGIYNEYVKGLRRREKRNQASEDAPPRDSGETRQFSALSEADQLDEIIMKYIFMRPQKANESFRQYSLISSVNLDLILNDEMRPFEYKNVEEVWSKRYKAEAAKTTKKPKVAVEQEKEVKQETERTKIKVPKRSQREYEDFINGDQSHVTRSSIEAQPAPRRSMKSQQARSLLKKTYSGNVIRDFAAEQEQLSLNKGIHVSDGKEGNDYYLKKGSISRQQERVVQSSRHFSSLSVQKQKLSAVDTTNRSTASTRKLNQLSVSANNADFLSMAKTRKLHESTLHMSNSSSQVGLRSQGTLQTVSTRGIKKAKSPSLALAHRTKSGKTLSTSRQPVIVTHRRTQRVGPIAVNPPAMSISHGSAILTNAAYQVNRPQEQISAIKTSKSKKQVPVSQSKKPCNFQDRVKAARQRGSIQYQPEELKEEHHKLIKQNKQLTISRNPSSVQSKTALRPKKSFETTSMQSLSNLQKSSTSSFTMEMLRPRQKRDSEKGLNSESPADVTIPDYSEKRALPAQTDPQSQTMLRAATQGLISKPTDEDKLSGIGSDWVLAAKPQPQSKMHISYEMPSNVNSFVNIVTHEESLSPQKQPSQASAGPWQLSLNKPIEELREPKIDTDGEESKEIPVTQAEIVNQLYNSTENFKDSVNEMVDEEADMAQKTAYHLQYRSKFKQLNSDDQQHIQGVKEAEGQQAKPKFNKSLSSVLYKQSSGVSSVARPSDLSLASGSSGQEQLQKSQSRVLLKHRSHNTDTAQQSIASKIDPQTATMKQRARKSTMPLSQLLQRSGNKVREQRLAHGGSERVGDVGTVVKARSITEKQQLTFQAIARLGSIEPQVVRTSNLFPESVAAAEHESGAENEDEEGWFTSIESKHLSEKMREQPPIVTSQETHQKLRTFYADIDESFIEKAPKKYQESHSKVAQVRASQENLQQAMAFARKTNKTIPISVDRDQMRLSGAYIPRDVSPQQSESQIVASPEYNASSHPPINTNDFPLMEHSMDAQDLQATIEQNSLLYEDYADQMALPQVMIAGRKSPLTSRVPADMSGEKGKGIGEPSSAFFSQNQARCREYFQ